MTRPTSDTALTFVSLIGSTALQSALAAAWRRAAIGAIAGTGVSMAVTPLAWRRYAKIWETNRPQR
ncbi:MAG: hypothetical protein ACRDUS_17200 [Mycobacterium sp.]